VANGNPVFIEGSGDCTVLDFQIGASTVGLTLQNLLVVADQPSGFDKLMMTNSTEDANFTYVLIDQSSNVHLSNFVLDRATTNDGAIGLQIGTASQTASPVWNNIDSFLINKCANGITLLGNSGGGFHTNENRITNGLVSGAVTGISLTDANANYFSGVNVESTINTVVSTALAWDFQSGANQNQVFGGSADGLTQGSVMVRFAAGTSRNSIKDMLILEDIIEDPDGMNTVEVNQAGGAIVSSHDRNVRSRIAGITRYLQTVSSAYGISSPEFTTPVGGFGRYQNLLGCSEDLDSGTCWSTGAALSVTANNAVAPDGTTTAETLTSTESAGIRFQNSAQAAAGQNIVCSVWLRAPAGAPDTTLVVRGTLAPNETEECHVAPSQRWERLACAQTFTGSAGGNVQLQIKPEHSEASGGTIEAWGAQCVTTAEAQPSGGANVMPPKAYVQTIGANPGSAGAGAVFNSGVYKDGGGFKHARVATGSIAAGDSAAVTASWATPFKDTSYTVIGCEVEEATAATLALRKHHIESRTAADLTVRVVNDDGDAAHIGTLHCTAVHD
jgi:hypothetical protein